MTTEAEYTREDSFNGPESTNIILSGIPDFTYGEAEGYFRKLGEEDREIVSWYLQQGVGPYQAENYVISLARGYAIADPERTASAAMDSAHVELRRITRLIEIFLADGNFFPYLEICNVSARDENGNYEGSIDVWGWTSFGTSNEGICSLQGYKERIRDSQISQYIELAHGFIDDPSHAPHVFNQAEMLEEARQSTIDLV